MLIRLSTPSGLAVQLADLKQALRVDHDDDDDVLKRLIRAQTTRYEDFTGRMMLPTEMEYRIDCWQEPISLPAYPVRSVTTVSYLDTDDVEQALDPGDWYSITTDRGAEIRFTDAFDQPDLSDRPQAVRVLFDAGYDDMASTGAGAEPQTTPDAADAHMITLMVGRIYDGDAPMGDDLLRQIAGHRRIFR